MNKIYKDLTEIRTEIEYIKLKEIEFRLTKKQHLAYELLEVMKSTQFTEAKLLGTVSSMNDSLLGHGVYFDAKTQDKNYIDFNLYDFNALKMSPYIQRIQGLDGQEDYLKLKELSKCYTNFMKNNDDTLSPEIENRMREEAFKCNLDSILKVVMTTDEYAQWGVLKEQQEIGDFLSAQSPVAEKSFNKKEIKKI